MRNECLDCLGSGASIRCDQCDGYFHHYCGELHCYAWKPFASTKSKLIQNVVLERRYLYSIWKAMRIDIKETVVRVDKYLCDDKMTFYAMNYERIESPTTQRTFNKNAALNAENGECKTKSTSNNNCESLKINQISSDFKGTGRIVDFPFGYFNFLSNRKVEPLGFSLCNCDFSAARLNVWNRNGINPYKSKCHYPHLSDLTVTPSRIACIGVMAGRAFNPGEPIIEYVGELIGRAVANQREKLYDKLNRGCYKLKIDDDCIVDATMTGNKARFINHSCIPNCKTKHVPNIKAVGGCNVPNKKRIYIFASERVEPGDELCYDYKFPRE